ncbi:MAG: hypothetical protein U0872_16100 [Planctomycetaceae bacterium]
MPWKWSRWTWAVAVPLMLVSYVLGTGPILWLVSIGILPEAVLPSLQIVYLPLALTEGIPVIGDALQAYVRWWIDIP